MSAAAGTETAPRPAVTAGIGAALLLLGAGVLLDSRHVAAGAVQGVGPAAAMQLVAGLLALLGVAHLVVALRARGQAAAEGDTADHRALGWVLAALAGLITILQLGGGFVVASAWLFVLTARGFGAAVGAKSVLIGLALAAAVYAFFTQALSLGLPAGPLERLVG